MDEATRADMSEWTGCIAGALTHAVRSVSPIGISELRRMAADQDTAPASAAASSTRSSPALVDAGSFRDLVDTIEAGAWAW